MAGNYTGSVLNTVSLGGVTASQNLTPSGGVIVAANTLFTNAGNNLVGTAYNDSFGTSGLWGSSWAGAVTWTVSGTGLGYE